MKLKVALACLTLTLAHLANANEVYPRNASTRLFGTSQGNVGDCQAESEVAALETAFAENKVPLRLSLFYRYTRIWMSQASQTDHLTDVNAADAATLAAGGNWIPDYMWPEDGEDLNTYATGVRPRVSEAALLDPDYRPMEAFGYTENQRAYKQGYANTGSFAELKALVDAHRAVTVAIHGDMLQRATRNFFNWNVTTGLLENTYTWDLLVSAVHSLNAGANLQTSTDHSVALVGYDDALYADKGYSVPGAFIVRNSWNDEDEIRATEALVTDPAIKTALASMRNKISKYNLPGYYAIPYQYFIDLFNRGVDSTYVVMDLDYVRYAAQYETLKSRYRIVEAPFACGFATLNARNNVTSYATNLAAFENKHSPPSKRTVARNALRDLVERAADGNDFGFSIAKIPQNIFRKTDHLTEFYSGKYNRYYCNNTADALWPDASFLARHDAQRALDFLTEDNTSRPGWILFLNAVSAWTQPPAGKLKPSAVGLPHKT